MEEKELIKSHAEFLVEKFPGFTIDLISHKEPGVVASEVREIQVRSSIKVVNGEEEPQYLGSSPIPVGDNDYLLCVALIETAEPACVDP